MDGVFHGRGVLYLKSCMQTLIQRRHKRTAIPMLEDYSKHQQGIIKRYYDSFDKIQVQKLSEMVSELFLADGKKKEKLWKSAATIMEKLEIPKERIDHIVSKNDPTLVAKLVKELMG